MKKTIPFAACAMLGLSLSPIHAADAATTDKPAAEQAAVAKVPVYLVVFSGKGWGVGAKASSALKSQDGVKSVLLSGYRATVLMEDGKTLDKSATEKAIVGKGLKMTSYEKTETVVPDKAYELAVTGTGWSIENDKARVALEQIDGVTAAYVDKKISIHYAKTGSFDEAKVAAILKPLKMTVKSSKQLDTLPF